MKLLDAALFWYDAGCSVVPAAADGSKRPFGEWKRYMETRPSRAQVTGWFTGDTYDGLGLVCGPVSGGLEMFEVEGRAVTEGTLDALVGLLADHGLADVWQRIDAGYKEATPSGGMHWLYRVDGSTRRSLKLARRPASPDEQADNPDERVKVLIETRGDGGFTIVAPSAGRTHPSRGAWARLAGSPSTIPTISEDERDALHAVASLLDQMPPQDMPVRRVGVLRDATDGLRPGDDYNQRGEWDELLPRHGWTRYKAVGPSQGWTRPGKSHGISATTGRNDGDNLYVFSSSTPFEIEKPYTKFAAYALLDHDGDYSAAARALAAQGYGSRPAGAPPRTDGSLALAPDVQPLPAPTVAADAPWDPPEPLGAAALPPFPTHALGPDLAELVETIAEDTQTPTDLAGMLCLAVLSAAVGKGARVRVTPGWSEQLSLYVAVALPAGEGKSPVFKRLVEPLRALERELAADLLPVHLEAAQRRRVLESRVKTLEATAAKKSGPEGDEAYAEAQALNLQLAQTPVPVTPRLFVDDVTSEALVGVLAEQDGQVALLSEEGGIFGTLAGRYSSGQPNLDAVLKAHDGGTIRVDRKTSEPLFVESPALTIGLAVQPSVLRSLADEEALRGRGLIARFLYAVPQSRVGERDVRRRMAPASAETASANFADAVRSLFVHRRSSAVVSLSRESLSLLVTFCEELERRRHRESGDLGAILDWSAKLDGATVRLVGLLALASAKSAEGVCADVEAGPEVVERAITLARYLIPHAQAALGLMDPRNVDTEPAAQVLAWLRRQGLTESCVRDVHNALRGRHLFKKVEHVEAALAVLLDRGWVRLLPVPPHGRGRPPSPKFAVNPMEAP